MTGPEEDNCVPAARRRRLGRELVVETIFGPIADRLALALRPLGVPPPALVLANGVTGLAVALALVQGAFVAAAVLLQLKTLLDNADGRLARVSGRVTLTGRYLDTEVDLAVNVVVFAALGWVTGEPWLALAALCSVTLVLSVNFNLAALSANAHGYATPGPAATGGTIERALERLYGLVYAWQDRLLRAASERRLEAALAGDPDPALRRAAMLAYHDRGIATVLANLGLSTQLAVLGGCLVAGAPELYLWLAAGSVLVLPLLQLRREWLARHAVVRGPAVPAPATCTSPTRPPAA